MKEGTNEMSWGLHLLLIFLCIVWMQGVFVFEFMKGRIVPLYNSFLKFVFVVTLIVLIGIACYVLFSFAPDNDNYSRIKYILVGTSGLGAFVLAGILIIAIRDRSHLSAFLLSRDDIQRQTLTAIAEDHPAPNKVQESDSGSISFEGIRISLSWRLYGYLLSISGSKDQEVSELRQKLLQKDAIRQVARRPVRSTLIVVSSVLPLIVYVLGLFNLSDRKQAIGILQSPPPPIEQIPSTPPTGSGLKVAGLLTAIPGDGTVEHFNYSLSLELYADPPRDDFAAVSVHLESGRTEVGAPIQIVSREHSYLGVFREFKGGRRAVVPIQVALPSSTAGELTFSGKAKVLLSKAREKLTWQMNEVSSGVYKAHEEFGFKPEITKGESGATILAIECRIPKRGVDEKLNWRNELVNFRLKSSATGKDLFPLPLKSSWEKRLFDIGTDEPVSLEIEFVNGVQEETIEFTAKDINVPSQNAK